MIKRYYAYSLITQTDKPKFSCGVICHKSWFANPNIAYKRVLDDAVKQFACDINRVRVEYFGRV